MWRLSSKKRSFISFLLGFIAPNPHRKFLKCWAPNSWDIYKVSEQGLMKLKHQENSSKRRKNNFICAFFMFYCLTYTGTRKQGREKSSFIIVIFTAIPAGVWIKWIKKPQMKCLCTLGVIAQSERSKGNLPNKKTYWESKSLNQHFTIIIGFSPHFFHAST